MEHTVRREGRGGAYGLVEHGVELAVRVLLGANGVPVHFPAREWVLFSASVLQGDSSAPGTPAGARRERPGAKADAVGAPAATATVAAKTRAIRA